MQKIVSLLTRSDDEAGGLLSQRAPLTAHDCYQAAVSHFRSSCFNWHSPMVSAGPGGCRLQPPSFRGPTWPFPAVLNPKVKLILSTGNHVHWKSRQRRYLVEGSIQAHSKAFDRVERKKGGQLH